MEGFSSNTRPATEDEDLIPQVNSWYEIPSGPNTDIPCPRSLHSCIGFENNLYIFGGYDGV